MAQFRHILAATDFSTEGNNAVWRAAAMARVSGADMGIVHVVDPAGYQPLRDWRMPSYQLDMKEARARAQLRQLAIDVAADHGFSPSVYLHEGDASEEIVRAAAASDLLVLGRPHRRGFRDLLTTRTTDRVLRASQQPVLVARNAVNGPYSSVLVPIDFTASSDAALRAATQLGPDMSLRLFHAIDAIGETVLRDVEVPAWVVREIRERENAGARARMRRHVSRLGLDQRAMQFAVGRGQVTLATAEHARQQAAELMVITRTARRSLGAFFRANASARLLQSCACDVLLLVPQNDAQAQSLATAAPPRNASIRGIGAAGLPAGAGALKWHDSQFNWLGRP